MSNSNWNGNFWSGIYNKFSDVPVDSSFFEEKLWIEKNINKVQSLLNDFKKEENSGDLSLTSDYLLPYLISFSYSNYENILVLDFGGGIGSTYLNLMSLTPMKQVNYSIVENRSTCEIGNKLFEEFSNVYFFEKIPGNKKYNVSHFGSSIQYIDDWKSFMCNITNLTSDYIVFTDLTAGDVPTFVTSQRYYGKSIPVRFFNEKEFVRHLNENDFELIFRSNFRGYYLNKDQVLPMNNFPVENRLNFTLQMVFKRKITKK
jgi:putative methyltransferase (TIGR04325 family)